ARLKRVRSVASSLRAHAAYVKIGESICGTRETRAYAPVLAGRLSAKPPLRPAVHVAEPASDALARESASYAAPPEPSSKRHKVAGPVPAIRAVPLSATTFHAGSNARPSGAPSGE